MKALTDMKKFEKKLFFSYANDGLADILMGLWMILAGLFMLIGQPVFMGLSGLPVLLYLPLKRSLVIPRMGDVSFSKQRNKRLSNLSIFSMIAGMVILLFIIFRKTTGPTDQIVANYLHMVFGLIIALLFCFVALFTTIARFYVYAGFSIILFSLDKVIFHSIPLVQLIFGVIVFLAGSIIFITFMIKNPLSEGTENAIR